MNTDASKHFILICELIQVSVLAPCISNRFHVCLMRLLIGSIQCIGKQQVVHCQHLRQHLHQHLSYHLRQHLHQRHQFLPLRQALENYAHLQTFFYLKFLLDTIVLRMVAPLEWTRMKVSQAKIVQTLMPEFGENIHVLKRKTIGYLYLVSAKIRPFFSLFF